MTMEFNYRAAFSRNIGWLSDAEQALLRHKRIAIAGLGGVGGSHLLTLARLGVGAFHIADYDQFELANFNRQAGASMASLGRAKAEVLAEQVLAINPELDLKVFADGVSADNLPAFLEGVDLYVDGLDFFVVEIRNRVFAACTAAGIPAITAAPLGMGTALLNFLPGKMSFEEYFRLDGQPPQEQLVRFLLGLSPAMLQRSYLVEPRTVDFVAQKGPSTPMACELCAGFAATQALKILLRRGKVPAAPWGLHFDAYRNRMVRTWRPGGNRNPVQRLGLAIARRQLAKMAERRPQAEPEQPLDSPALQVIEHARWAPSGDNAQPWRFSVQGERRFRVHGFDTRDHCIYDLQGHASQLAHGALLESVHIAASELGYRAECSEPPADEGPWQVDVELVPDASLKPDPLAAYLRLRTVQRKPLRTRALRGDEIAQLEQALGESFSVRWFQGWRGRWRMARMLFRSAGLRLALPEAYETHRDAVDWQSDHSDDRIPVSAVGFNPLSARMTAWAMGRWPRVQTMNRIGASLFARLELDLMPGLLCGAHFVLLAKQAPRTREDFLAAGRAMQRFWLTAAKLGLQIQPQTTPLIFHEYQRDDVAFTDTEGMLARARQVAQELQVLMGEEALETAVFMGRIGAGEVARYRSERLPMTKLLTPRAAAHDPVDSEPQAVSR